jgi:hypothetical protein
MPHIERTPKDPDADDPDALLQSKLGKQRYRLLMSRLRLAQESLEDVQRVAPELFTQEMPTAARQALKALTEALQQSNSEPRGHQQSILRMVKR